MRARPLALAVLLAAVFVASCGDDGCEGDCFCAGAECVCPATGDCEFECTKSCDLYCPGVGDCDFKCRTGCDATCAGEGDCAVEAGESSEVECRGTGACEVDCYGSCTVACLGDGPCTLRCLSDGATCSLESCNSEQSCGDGVTVCGRSC